MKSKLQKDIDSYVRKYANKYNITKEQALTHERVQNVIAWLMLREEGTKTYIIPICRMREQKNTKTLWSIVI